VPLVLVQRWILDSQVLIGFCCDIFCTNRVLQGELIRASSDIQIGAVSMNHGMSLLVLCLVALTLTGCHTAASQETYLDRYPATECPGSMRDKLKLRAEAIPISLPTTAQSETSALGTHGIMARRIVVSVIPSGLNRSDALIQSRLKIRSWAAHSSAHLR
jgi:hypothetical protein